MTLQLLSYDTYDFIIRVAVIGILVMSLDVLFLTIILSFIFNLRLIIIA